MKIAFTQKFKIAFTQIIKIVFPQTIKIVILQKTIFCASAPCNITPIPGMFETKRTTSRESRIHFQNKS